MARKNIVVYLVLLLFITACSSQSNNQIKMVTHPILAIERGILEEHKSITPIFERVDNMKRQGYKATKTYEDGTHYSLIDPGLENFDNIELRWEILARINKQGIIEIKAIISDLNPDEIEKVKQSPIGFTPTINWFFHIPRSFELETKSGMYENLPKFIRNLDDAINRNVIILEKEE